MKKNLLTTMAFSCAFVLGGLFTSCTSSDDNPSPSVKDPVFEKLCKENTWFDQVNIEALNSVWAYTFNSDGSIMTSGLSKFGDPDQLIGMHFKGIWKAINDYNDPYEVVNSNVRCYAVELKMTQLCIDDGDEIDIDDAPVYKDTLLVQYKGSEMKLVMTSDIERYIGEEGDLWGAVKAAVPVSKISEQDIIDSCIELVSNLSDEQVEDILGNLNDEEIDYLIEILEVLSGEDFSDIIKDDDEEE